MATTAVSALEALKRIESEMRAKGSDEIPEGFHPVEWWAQQWDKSQCRSRELLKDGVRVGVLEKQQFRVGVANRIQKVDHYRELQKKKLK